MKQAEESGAVLSVNGLVKVYGKGDGSVHALDNAKFMLEEGAFGVITGPSGSGKSTLLEICGGMAEATAGQVIFEGKDILHFDDRQRAEYRLRKIGFVFQRFYLMDNLTLEENIAMPALIAGRKSFQRQVKELAEQMGIEKRLHHFPNEVSGGEKQRCAIARGIINDPKLLFADEPTGNLDSETSAEIVELLLNLNKNGMTILLVTHNEKILQRIGTAARKPVWFTMQNGVLTRQSEETVFQ